MFCFRKNHGAISVFLVMILVPCMLIASIFVDISRVQLARAVAESSADLALSTLMSNYDYDLSEYYGLMGSCQNISEYYSLVTEYYDTALHSRDVSDEEIQLLYQRVMNDIGGRFSDETISDILRVRNLTDGAVISPLEGANMYNATILQEQIVEFMKYRGPIVIVQEIIEKIKSDPGVEALQKSGENKTVVDDKTDFYEAEGELLKTAFDVYWLTRDYTDKVGDNGENMSAGKLQEYARNLEGYRTAYGEIHQYLVGNLINTGDLTGVYNRVTIELDTYTDDYDETSPEIYSRVETPTPSPAPAPGATDEPSSTPASSPEPVYYIDGEKVTALMEELTTAKDNFITAKNNFIDAGSGLMETLPGAGDSDAHAIQWWVRMNAAVNSPTGTNYTLELKNRADALAKAYAKVQAIEDCEPGNNMPSGWEEKKKELLDNVKSDHGQYLMAGITNSSDKYLNTVNQLEQISAANLSKIQAANLYVTVDGQSRSVADAVTYIQRQLDEMQKTVKLYEGLLDKLLEASSGGTSPMDSLYDLAGEYDDKLKTWTYSANTFPETDMKAKDREEIEGLKSLHEKESESARTQPSVNSGSMQITIDREAVQKMKTRLSNIRSQYQIMDNAIEGMKYGNTLLREILNVEIMKNCANTVVQSDSIGLTNQEVRGYAESTFSQLFVPKEGTIAALHDISDNAYNPLMSPVTKQIETPDLYLYMHSKFKDTPPSAVEEQEQAQKEANEEKDRREKEAKDRKYRGGGQNLTPTESSQGNSYKFTESALVGLIAMVSDLLKGDADNLRDNLYATTYIMEMLSYDTFETEGKYSIQGKKEGEVKKTELTLDTYKEVYALKEGTAEDAGTWCSADPKDSYNKTLTNRLINRDNNVAYLAEVEYILYGNNSNEDNVKAAYEDIYKIRYIVNLVSAFANFWSGSNNTSTAINGVANCIMGLTAGVIPAALTKVILLPILTVFETCNDVDRLAAGFPVELYKQSGDWWYSLEGIGDAASWEGKKVGDFMSAIKGILPGQHPNPDKGLQYSDYLTLFVYLGLQREDEASEKMYLRMADVIQANMRKATGESGYSLANTQVYFRLKAKLRVDPLMLTLPYYTDYVDDPSMKDDWCTFEVETIRGY